MSQYNDIDGKSDVYFSVDTCWWNNAVFLLSSSFILKRQRYSIINVIPTINRNFIVNIFVVLFFFLKSAVSWLGDNNHPKSYLSKSLGTKNVKRA